MWSYIARRSLQGLLVLFLVSFLVFSLVRLLPGDAILMQLDQAAAPTPENLEKARQELGLDRPFLEQYRIWISGVLRGDLGNSLTSRRPVLQELMKRVILTSHLAIMSLPDFWLATVTITFLAIWFRWMPPIGFAPIWVDPARNLSQMLLPALIIGARLAAVSMRMTRSSLLEVLRQDYIRTAWAKGLRERVVMAKHAFKNALIPVVTIVGQQFSVLLGGTVIVEFIFLQPGVGSLMLDAVVLRDYTMIQGAVLFFATVTIVMNLLVDVSYAWLDPRIRYS
jgi:peptide/nickel transport system permease protein